MTTLLRGIAAVAATATTALLLPLGLGAPASAERSLPPAVGPTTFAKKGPFGVGVRGLRLPSGAKVTVWYPAPKAAVRGKRVWSYDLVNWMPPALRQQVPDDFSVAYPSGGVQRAPVAAAKFPLVVFSHGYAGFRTQSSYLTSALASWGFVVAAPEHPSRDITRLLTFKPATAGDVDDLSATITLVGQKNRTRDNWLFRHVDMSRIAALGHSAGGRASEQLAVADKRVDTFVGMAGASVGALDQTGTDVPDRPGMIVAATDDTIVKLDRLQAAYDAMNAPKRMVLIGGSGHLVFSDLCEVGAGSGGLLAIGEALGLPSQFLDQIRPLATDGCVDPTVAPTQAWPAIKQVVIAYLRSTLGLDPTDAGLTGLEEAWPGIVVDDDSVTEPPAP